MGMSCGVIEGNTEEQVKEAVQQALEVASVKLVKHGMVANSRFVALIMGETASVRLALQGVQPGTGGDALLITRFICNPDRRCARHFMKLIEAKPPSKRGYSEDPGVRRRRWFKRLWRWRAA